MMKVGSRDQSHWMLSPRTVGSRRGPIDGLSSEHS
jgi:hypothetical protein